jgi:syntaxin-binding protein 1
MAQRAQYLNAHLYFTSHVPQAGMNLLKGAPVMKKLKSFVELNVDFISFESRVFLFDQPKTIPRLYFPTDHTKLSLVLSSISKPLVSLCITCNEFPHVRYSSLGKAGICKGLATFFDIDMKKTVSQLQDWKANESRERGTLLIVDRSMDPIAPLMHEYTFQAMVNDCLPVHGEIAELPVSLKGANGLPKPASELEADRAAAELVLSEDDQLWSDFRHKHIGTVMVDVTAKFKEFKTGNKMAQVQGSEKSSFKDMIQAMKDMPEYKNMMRKYHKHMSLAQECMNKFDSQKLTLLGELEQDMATGITNDGKVREK